MMDVNTGFEMYTDTADAYVEKVLTNITVTTRVELDDAVKTAVGLIGDTYEEIYDTEPQWAVVDWVNEHICTPNMWLPFQRDDLY